ncbi:MAG: hypothetical protein P2A85_13695 [Microcoleus anatoxicus]|uniref:hypothetical protein n=1 Tax=Microcoleus anatoxicus TaxID=2705319 RepID=UPI00366C02DC
MVKFHPAAIGGFHRFPLPGTLGISSDRAWLFTLMADPIGGLVKAAEQTLLSKSKLFNLQQQSRSRSPSRAQSSGLSSKYITDPASLVSDQTLRPQKLIQNLNIQNS